MAIAWALNLDAEHELARPRGYRRTPAVAHRMRALVPKLGALVWPSDVVLDPAPLEPVGDALGLDGRCWCPTPSALALIERSGATVPPAPPLDVLVRVNHRRFSVEAGLTMPGARWAERSSQVDDTVAEPTASGFWLLKRPLGFAGAGRRKLAAGPPSEDDSRWIAASLEQDGLLVEPWHDDIVEYALHGHLSRHGELTLGAPCRQRATPQGAWQASELAGADLAPSERSALADEANRAAAALFEAGYFGPFGIDAFRYEAERGYGFQPRSEINARYTMGWAIGMGGARPDR